MPMKKKKLGEVTRRKCAIGDFDTLGQQVLAADTKRPDKYGRQIVVRIAERNGASPDKIFKARRFAERYNKKALQQLLKLRTPEGLPLGVAHVRLLATVKDNKRRKELQEETVEKGWSADELHRQIQLDQGGKHGRGPTRPKSQAVCLLQLIDASEDWLAHYEVWFDDGAEITAVKDRSQDARKKVRTKKLIATALEAVSKVKNAADESIHKLKAADRVMRMKATKQPAAKR